MTAEQAPPRAAVPPPPLGRDDAWAAPAWVPTRALGRSVLLTGLLMVLGVALGRVDLVLLAAPFAIGTAVALRRMPRFAPEVAIDADLEHRVEGGTVNAGLSVANADVIAYDLVVVRARTSPWLRLEDADRPFAVTVPADAVAAIDLPGDALRWGRHSVGPAAARVAACGGLLACRPVVTPARDVRVYPVTEPFAADEAMPAAAGLVGNHRSRRPGEGGELAGVRPFAPGDRLRRIDWRVSLRTRDLHVASTLSDRDAEVLLLLDVLAEAGTSGGVKGSASVLDTTVRAAAAISEHYLHRGDRVSLLEYGASARRLRPASGRRQYLTVLEWLLDVRADGADRVPSGHVFGAHQVSADALVVVLTPLLDPRSADMLAQLTRSGRFTVAVDTLPAGAAPPQRGQWAPLATRLWRLERDNTLGRLREHGVPVVRWAGAGSLDEVLRDVARLASAPPGAADVLGAVTDRLARARTVASRATPAPLLVRCAVAICAVLALVVAYPPQMLTTRYAAGVVVPAVLPAFAPRGRAATVAGMVIVAGWVLDTTYFDRPVVLWRVLALATLLYLAHTLTALAAALPYDAVVRPDVIVHWLARAAAVVLASAVLTVVVLALTAELAGVAFLAATLAGLAAAVAVAVLLARLLRRP